MPPAIAPTPFDSRTPEGVCGKWNDQHPNRASFVWEAGADSCDNGTLNPESIDDGIRRINLYRWLVGLYPVYNRRESNTYAQPCAIMIKENGDLDHSPPTDWLCYSQEGASGAGHSNLAMGRRDPAGAIDLYIEDQRITSLGHRRWILDPPYLPAGIGQPLQASCEAREYLAQHPGGRSGCQRLIDARLRLAARRLATCPWMIASDCLVSLRINCFSCRYCSVH